MSDTKPTVDMPLRDAVKGMTGFEVLGAQQHYGGTLFENLGGIRTLLAAVWAYENRDGNKAAWNKIESMSLGELESYFATEDPDPESEQGKGEKPSASTPNG